jgi:hypothetical protein
MKHIEGLNRDQITLFPDALDDYITQENPVRFIDAFINNLDLMQMGFTHSILQETGRPPYHPGDLLKLYVYGYLNRIRSSRQLERESHRNVEVMWPGAHPTGLPGVHPLLQKAGPLRRRSGCHRWQQVQGRQQPQEERHQEAAQADHPEAGRGHRPLSG